MSLSSAFWNVQYMQRVLATDPIAYWMQDEKQGLVSYDMVTARSDGARNGAYTGVTLGQPGIGDGRTAPFFDGANDFDAVYSASLNAAFNGQQATLLFWFRAANAGVWTDGASRMALLLLVDPNNRFILQKQTINGQMSFAYIAGGVNKTVTDNSFIGRTEWISAMVMADRIADEMRVYVDGIQIGATLGGLGIWAGNLDPVRVLIGANTQAPTNIWNGGLAHIAAWARVLPPAEALSVGVL